MSPATAILLATVCAAAMVAIVYLLIARALKQIHTLVNSRLSEALREIRRLGGDSSEF